MKRVHKPEELMEAMRAGITECQYTDNAVRIFGPLYLKHLIEEAQAHTGTSIRLWCDCGRDVTAALAAIQAGLPHLLVDVDEAYFEKLEQMAQQQGVSIRQHNIAIAE